MEVLNTSTSMIIELQVDSRITIGIITSTAITRIIEVTLLISTSNSTSSRSKGMCLCHLSSSNNLLAVSTSDKKDSRTITTIPLHITSRILIRRTYRTNSSHLNG